MVTAVHPRQIWMTNKPTPQIEPGKPAIYQIRLKGQLAHQWAAWFEGLVISWADNGDTLLTGPVVDQAALHGLLRKVRDLGLPLLSVFCVEPDQTSVTDAQK